MIDDPLGTKSLASIDTDYFRKLLPKTIAGRSALDAAASEIYREIARVETQQRKITQQALSPSSRSSLKAFQPDKDGVDPLAFLSGGAAGVQISAPKEPTRSGMDLPVDILAGLGAGVTGMGKTAVDLVAPESAVSKSLSERIDTLNTMQSEVEQNARKEMAAEVERYKKENPDASALDIFGQEMLATGGNLSIGTGANLVGSMAAGMGAAGKVGQVVSAARGAAAGIAAGTAVGAGVEGISTAGEVRGAVYDQVSAIPLTDPNLQANADFQKYLVEARGDVDPKGANWSPLQEYQAQRTAREKLALDSRVAAAVAGVAGAALSAFGPERAFAKAAANRAAAEAVGSTVGLATRSLDNALVKVPTSAVAEGLTEVAPTLATNENMQNVDPTRGAMEGAGGNFVLGMLGGVGGEGASAVLERATDLTARTPTTGAPRPGTPAATDPASVAATARITPVTAPDGTVSYRVRQVDDTLVDIPSGPDAQTEAELVAQQSQDEFDSLGTTSTIGADPLAVDAFGTKLIVQPDGTMDYAQDAVRNAEADAFINQVRQQATGAPATPATPVVEPTPAPEGVTTDPTQENAPAPATESALAPEFASSPVVEARMQHNLSMLLKSGLRANQPVTAFGTAVMRDSDGVARYAGGAEPNPIADELIRRANATSQAAPAAELPASPAEIQLPADNLQAAIDEMDREFIDSPLFDGTGDEILNRANSGAFSPAVSTVIQDLANDNWLDYESPRAAIRDMLQDRVPLGAVDASTEAAAQVYRDSTWQFAKVSNRDAAPSAQAQPALAEDTPQRESAIKQAHQRIVNQTVKSEFMSGDAAEITNRARSVGFPQAIHTLVNALSAADWLGYFNPRDALEAALTLDLAPATTPPGVIAAATAARNVLRQRAVEHVANAANRQVAEIPLDRPTAEVPTLTETVATPAPTVDADGIPLTGPLTQEQANRANDAINAKLFLDKIRDDIRLTLAPEVVMRLAKAGNAFSRELSNLLRGLNSADWLGRATPAEAVQFAIGDTQIPSDILPEDVVASARIIRNSSITSARQRSRDRGVRRILQSRVGRTLSPSRSTTPTGPAVPGVEQAPSTTLRSLSLDDAKVKELATAVQPFARIPLGEVPDRGRISSPNAKRKFFIGVFEKLLNDQGYEIITAEEAYRITRSAYRLPTPNITTPSGVLIKSTAFHIKSPTGAVVEANIEDTGNGGINANGVRRPAYTLKTTTTGFTAGSEEGAPYYSALNAAAVAAGMPLYNGTYTPLNISRLPINRMKAILQVLGASGASVKDAAKYLGLSTRAVSVGIDFPLNKFNHIAQQVIYNAERFFPNATASSMFDGGNAANYLTGVLRLNPDGTFDTPAGTMTAEELRKYTRVNNEGVARYNSNLSTAFGASSYSSMALAATLRSYMEATTDAQRQQVLQAVEQISSAPGQDASGNPSRPFAYLDLVDPDAAPAEGRRRSPIVGDVITPSGRGYTAVVKTLQAAARTGVLPKDAVDLTLALLKKNPALANDLGIAVDGTVDEAGAYNSVAKIVSLFASANPRSGVHEILHHTERMLPKAARAGILKAYNAAMAKALETATPKQQKAIEQLVKDSSGLGGEGAKARIQQVFADGTLKYSEHYQLANPSEFWAVNASKLFAGQQGKTGWRNAARAWLQGFVQKAKSILGLPNNNAMLQGLRSVLKADGSFVSNVMLAQDNARNLEPIFNDIPDGSRNTPPGTVSTTGDQTAPRSRQGFDELQQHIRSGTALPAASPERALAQALDRNQVTEPGQATRAIDARLQQLGEAFHDHLGPVERLFTDIGEGSRTLRSAGERVVGAMRAAPGKRDNIMRQMIEDHGGNQLFSAIERIARAQRMTLEDATGYVGYWLTAQRAPTANARLIARDTREVERTSRERARTESALNTARNTAGTNVSTLNQLEADVVGAARQLGEATRELTLRVQAVNNPRASGVSRHVAGVAGFNNAQAAELAADIEQRIPREMLQQAAERVYDLNAFRIVTDLESGRSTPEVVAQFLDNPALQPLLQQLVAASRPDAQQEGSQANRDALRAQVMSAVRSNYVPLTGDPQTALYDESPGGGASQPNTGRTYMMEGRQDSMPDDGVTATMAGLIRSASHAGWAPFQDSVADIYEQMTPDQRNEFGIHRETRQVTDRSTGSNNSALIRLRGDTEQRFEFSDKKILDAIHNETIADTDASLSKLAKGTKLYSWAATRFNLTFAPRNMVRDVGERADILLSKELFDEQGNKISSPQVVKSMIYNATVGLPKMLNAGVRYVLNGTAGGMSEASHYLRELQDSGNLSTFGQRFQNSRIDFVNQLKSAKTSNQSLRALNRYTLELWNTPFDFVAPLASYMAMRKNGVVKEQAQAIALELMNFRKRGTQMKTLGAAYPFAQTAVTGGVNMARSLVDARNGKLKPYAVARLTGYVLTLSALRAMFMAAADDDEGGNKLAQLPAYEHDNNIIIPTDEGIIKVPLPFGLMRVANGIVNNTLSYAGNEKSGGAAVSDFLTGTIIPSFAPISESPLDGEQYPIQKFFATLAPPIIKPPLQVAMGLTAFGAPLKNEYAKQDKFISDQPKLNTPAAYATMAQTIRQWTGIDVPPEAVRELVKGYPLGVAGYARSGALEDKAVAEEIRKPFYAPYPEAARYFQFKKAQDQASTELKKLERGDTDYDAAKIKWFKDYNKIENKVQGQIASITKSKGLSDTAKTERKEELRAKRSLAQNEALYKWRTEILKAEAKRTE